MHSGKYSFIKFISYKALSLWDVKRYVQNQISFHNSVKLKDVLTPSVEPISKEEILSKNWQIISKINFAGKLYLRDKSETKTFKGNLNKVDSDSLIYSKINVRHGCIYYHPINAIPFAVSSEYPVYKIDSSKVLGDYLVLVIQSNGFKSILDKKATGISKARVKPQEFLEIEIPIPALSNQKEILLKFKDKIGEAEKIENNVIQIDKDLNTYLLGVLKVSGSQSVSKLESNYGFLKFHRLKGLSRWDLYNEKEASQSKLYDNIKLSEVICSKPQYGAGYSSKLYDGNTRYIRITDINEDGSLNEYKVSAKGFSERYVLKENDFLIARSGNTVGKTFLYRKNIGKAIYAGYLIRFELDTTKILPDYLLAYTKCSIYKNWIKGNMRVSAQPNINSRQYLDSPIVLPPLNVQKEIVEHVNVQRELAKQLKTKANAIREKALKEFENEIFE